jgi:hypothetical protein
MKKRVTERSTRPVSQRKQMVVFVDGAKNFYELSRTALQRHKVSARRKREVAEALEDVEAAYTYIKASAIPGSTAKTRFVGGAELAYAGFYITTIKRKR